MADQEGFIEMLEDSCPTLDLVPVKTDSGQVEYKAEHLTQLTEEDDWSDDPAGVAWNKIRSVFMRAKSPAQLFIEAKNMTTGQWLDYVMKMAPKDVKVTAEFSFKHLLEELGPIDKDKYRIIDAEFSEV